MTPSSIINPFFSFSFLYFISLSLLIRALTDVWCNIRESNRTENDQKIKEVVVMVVGAGRGPLVCATLRYEIAKNINRL